MLDEGMFYGNFVEPNVPFKQYVDLNSLKDCKALLA